jgi:HTH-type transcriptional regulator, transcriptional repressor of NAD biosynthesis genes
MKTGLVLGKFYPLHTGHIELINFALPSCDELIVLLCASDKELIAGEVRLKWIKETFKETNKIKPFLLLYSDHDLPNTSISSKEVSKLWADKIRKELPKIDIVFSSEQYGDYLAQYLNCQHISYDVSRAKNPVSATVIRENPLKHWNEIAPAARNYFVKKVCISGTESTGKSTLTELLAKHYETEYVPEMARNVLEHTDQCTEEHLLQIAQLHARTIEQKLHTANKLLFVDTDINITRSYSKYLFCKELAVESWIHDINHFDLYLFLDNDAPHVQDGTRLDKKRRDDLDLFHRNELKLRNIKFEVISGSWNDRFEKAIAIINEKFRL